MARTRSAPRAGAATIREARPGDLEALARLGAKLAREHHAMDPARFFLPEEPIEEGYAWWLGKELRNRDAVVLAATRRGRVVGYAYGRIEPREWRTLRDRCGVGIDLWVEPSERGAGLGAALVEALASGLEARGAPRVILEVAARNPRAARLFRSLGFRPTLVELAREAGAAARRGRGRRGEGARASSPRVAARASERAAEGAEARRGRAAGHTRTVDRDRR